jgi:hypothetical protein
MKYLFFLIISFSAYSADWYCKSVASERIGNTVKSCGIGEGLSENDAREASFLNARKEFLNICQASDDCKSHLITIVPQRTSCEVSKDNKFICHRLLEFVIGEKVKDSDKNKIEKIEEKKDISQIKPFYFEETLDYPKVYIGSSKKDVLKNFGIPHSVEQETWGLSIRYKCTEVVFCASNNSYESAYIYFNKKDFVESMSNIHPNYSGLLK